jgi:ParB family chromosome partitioning protein
MVTKFSQKAAAIHFNLPSAEEQQTRPEAATRQRPRTAVGSHVDALYRDRELADEADRLRANLKDFEGSLPTKPLDPNDVVLSRFANRHPDSYCDHEFHALRDEIQAAGGNIQPIKVRPIPHRPGKYELSFGSRRRQACLELGLPVLAMIEEMDDETLFAHMERENRQRKNLRPYEQGVLYLKALEEKLYPSARKMAADLQIDATGVTRLLAIARLPEAVLGAFASPLDIQFDWGAFLNDALQRNPDAVLARAAELKSDSARKSPKHVLEQLVAAAAGGEGASAKATPVELRGSGSQRAILSFGKKSVSVKITNLPPEKRAALEQAIRTLIS